MKILVVQDRLRSGGTERQSVFLSGAFARAGHPTTLLTFRPGGELAATVPATVRRVTLQPFDLGLDWLPPGLGGALAREQPDLILTMGRMANCWGATIRRLAGRRRPGVRLVGTMRTGKALPAWFRRSLLASDQVVANSRDAHDALVERYGIPASKISVIYNSLVFPPAAADGSAAAGRARLRAEYGSGAARLILLCVAMFRPEKNQRELIEIVAGLPADRGVHLWLAGDGPARAACETLVARRSWGDRVKFVGFHRTPTPLYRAADLAVHASTKESLSNFLIEAQAHGLPAVAYSAQGISECFVPNVTGWAIPYGDRDTFRQRLERLQHATAEERAERSATAQRFARETFDPDRQVQAYLQLFARV